MKPINVMLTILLAVGILMQPVAVSAGDSNVNASMGLLAKSKKGKKKSRKKGRRGSKRYKKKQSLGIFAPLLDKKFLELSERLSNDVKDVAEQTGAFSKIKVIIPEGEENPVEECGSMNETLCLCGMAMEKGVDLAIYFSITYPQSSSMPVVDMVLANSKKIKEIKRVSTPVKYEAAIDRAVSKAACEVLSNFGCNPKQTEEEVQAETKQSTAVGAGTAAKTKKSAMPKAKQGVDLTKVSAKPKGNSAPDSVKSAKKEEEDILYAETPKEKAAEEISHSESGVVASVAATPTAEVPASAYLEVAGWTTFGVGMAALAAGGAMWLMAHLSYNKYKDAKTTAEAISAKDDTTMYSKTAIILGITGGAITVGGITLLITGAVLKASEEDASTAVLEVSPFVADGFAGIGVIGRF